MAFKSNEIIVSFSGKVVKCTYDTPEFKIYALSVDKNRFPHVKFNKYGNVSIKGELFDLSFGVEYEIIGIEEESKYGFSYKVKEIKRPIPKKGEEVFAFLSEILTYNQASELFTHYPDIIDIVRRGETDQVNLEKVKGIKEKSFKKIVQKITENFCILDLITDFKGYLTLNTIKKLYAKYESVAKIKSMLQADPYDCLCSIAGIGFVTADKLLLDIEKASLEGVRKGEPPIVPFKHDLKTSPERCFACIQYILLENQTSGNTKMNLADLRSECMKIVPECAHHFATAVKEPKIYYDIETMDVSMRYIYMEEKYIADKIMANLHQGQVWECDPEKYRQVNGAILSDEQVQVIHNVCNHPISILNGAAGCGKSFSMQAVINMLDDFNKSYLLLAPTGKASKVLAAFTNRPASTIHRGLGYSAIGFRHHECCPFDDDIIIVDEFSMVDVSLFKHLISAIDFTRTKLLMIGDNAQLPSVSCGNLFHDFMMAGIIPTTTLTKVFRYGEGGLMRIATDVRNSKRYLDSSMKSNVSVFGNNHDYIFLDVHSEMIPKKTVTLYEQLLKEGGNIENIQVLTAKNVGDCGTVVLNNMIQKIANPNYGSDIRFTCGETTYYIGDLVIQKANNYHAKLSIDHMKYDDRIDDFKNCYDIEVNEYGEPIDPFIEEELAIPRAFIANGESGIVTEIEGTTMTIRFDDMYVVYDKSDCHDIGLGYAISIHKSQGSSIDHVIICSPESHAFMMNSNLLYVALTRMKKRCFHVGSLNAVNTSVKKKANLTRHTFMQQLLLRDIELVCKEYAESHKKKEDLPWYSDEELQENPNFFGDI